MYQIKYVWKSITRSMPRNLLIGFVVMLVTVSSIMSLSIRQAADDMIALQENRFVLKTHLVLDRNLLRSHYGGSQESMRVLMARIPQLALGDLQLFAASDSVERLTYSLQLAMNSDTIIPVGSETSSYGAGESGSGSNSLRGQFQLIGYEYPESIEAFLNGTYQMLEGSVYDLYDAPNTVLITDEMAMLNQLSLNDTIQLQNPRQTDHVFDIRIVGIYRDQGDASDTTSWFSASANQLIGHVSWVNGIEQQEAGQEDTRLSSQLIHSFQMIQGAQIESFREELVTKGLNEFYALRSNQSELEQLMQPFINLIRFTSLFMWLVMVVGALVLLTINMIQIRERKYEIGVLRALGMKKGRVAFQFVLELVIVAVFAMMVGITTGGVLAEPVGNLMLRQEIEQVITEQNEINRNLGLAQSGNQRNAAQVSLTAGQFIDEIKTPIRLTVLFQVLMIGVGIVLAGTAISLASISRYEPTKILSTQ